MKKFINNSEYGFTDISSEQYREYRFPGKEFVKIENPQMLAVSKTGHRVWDGTRSHFIPYGWVHLYWEVEQG